MKNIIITAIERDSFDVNVITLLFKVPTSDFNLKEAIKKTVADFLATDAGIAALEYTCGCFNWGDFATYITSEMCEKNGFVFIKSTSEYENEDVDFNEDLTDGVISADNAKAEAFVAYDIHWDVDECDEDAELNLPTSARIPAEELDISDDADEEEIADAISDWLSDTYGFCHDGFQFYCIE